MSREIVPISQLARRMPEQGRIRIGVKTNDSRRMTAINTFRLTSADKAAIEEAAERYGGTPAPWTDGPRADEWDLITEVAELPIALPPNALGGTPIYEMWSRGGCLRRCDGELCEVPRKTPEGDEIVQVPCLCNATDPPAMECKPKTRLTVVLRELRFGGGWRYETGSWHAAHEMPGMVDAITVLQQRGMARGLLALENDSKVVNGKTKKWKIVRLRMDASMEAIASGMASYGALGSAAPAPVAALPAGPNVAPSPEAATHVDPYEADDDVVEAELVDEPEDDLSTSRVIGGNQRLQTALILKVKELCDWHRANTGEALDDSQVRHDLVRQQVRRTDSSTQMTDEEKHLLIERIEKAMARDGLVFGVKEGKAKIGKRSG